VTTMQETLRGMKFQAMLGKVVTLLLLGAGTVLVLMPLVWMLSTSLKSKSASTRFPPEWIPRDVRTVEIEGRDRYIYAIPVEGQIRELALLQKSGQMGIFVNPDNPDERYELPVQTGERVFDVSIHWNNYLEAMTTVPFIKYLGNSTLIVVLTTIGTLVSSTLVAYGFARFRARWLNILFLVLLSTIMLPRQVTLIPTFLLFKKLGWYDTFLPLIVPTFFAGAWDVFLLRQYIMTIPLELDDAARIDGCSPLGTLWYIILPQITPALATVAIFNSLWAWNDFFYPLIYLQSPAKRTVALGLQAFQALYTRDTHLMMAASTVALLPCILIFFFAQRLFIQGVVVSGVKG
jgi:multiple sugar transport system permease protein